MLLQSEADEAEFRAEHGAGPFPLAVDYGRHSVVGYITESGAAGGRVTIETVTWDGELIEFTYSAEGVAAVAQGEEPAGYPAHLVLIRRIEAPGGIGEAHRLDRAVL